MSGNNRSEQLLREEQKKLDTLIQNMDEELLRLNKKLTTNKLKEIKEKARYLPEAYGDLVKASDDYIETSLKQKKLMELRDELYNHRLHLDVQDIPAKKNSKEELELNVGLHTYMKGEKIYISSWKLPICRHFLLDNASEEFINVVSDKHGKYKTRYQLQLKRKIDMRFDKVKSVIPLFPVITEDEEQIIADEFLQELLNRRSNSEFKNIVFSIQKKQGEIIQTPFRQNLIVQGCAGSGKSMIMLHRLPILLFDNPRSLNRNNLYIITPSQAYIQMAEAMRYQLEISDLKMGTLNQYYDHVIEKYGKKSDVYGEINPSIQLTTDQMRYIYSKQCADQILNDMYNKIYAEVSDYDIGREIFNINARTRVNYLPQSEINWNLLESQTIIDRNEAALREYFKLIRAAINEIAELKALLTTKKLATFNGIARGISSEEAKIKKARKELEKFDPEINKLAYDNRRVIILNSTRKIQEYGQLRVQVEENTEYFEILNIFKDQLELFLSSYGNLEINFEDNSMSTIYWYISILNILCTEFYSFTDKILDTEDLYTDYSGSIHEQFWKSYEKVVALESLEIPHITENYYKELLKTKESLSKLSAEISSQIYLNYMEKIGQKPDEKGNLSAVSCSPYLYLQILYLFQGQPNAAKESLITIDEAQGLAPQELRLISNVNDDKVIFNLFGDVKQHIEGTKGIDSWNELPFIQKFKTYYMLENYRNASQVTDYCNRKFHMSMQPINLDGNGVHEQTNFETFTETMTKLFMNVQKKGISAIIVKNETEAKQMLKQFSAYQNKIHDMTGDNFDLHRTRWNLMTVNQVKGLEFGTVVAVSGRMTRNEKYITYTRALDELFVYEQLLDITKEETEIFTKEEKELPNSYTRTRVRSKIRQEAVHAKETSDYSDSSVRKYFEAAGLKVVDERVSGGDLWILGSKEQLRPYVTEAVKKFNISGSYYLAGNSRLSKNKEGWHTKTKD